MNNITDITNVSDNVLDCFLAAKADKETPVDCDHLTRKERFQLADLMGWDFDKYSVVNWCLGAQLADESPSDTHDYENEILKRQEKE